MKNIELTDMEAEILARHICERLQRLGVNMESTTQATVVVDAEIQRIFYQSLLQRLGFKREDLDKWEVLLKDE